MNKQCTQCSASFNITDEDLQFYDKVSPVIGDVKHDIPAPTMCPECRRQRRWVFRNERNLFTSKCAKTNEPIITNIHPEAGFTTYNQSYTWSDDWDAKDFGKDYDDSRSFFEQMGDLVQKVPQLPLMNMHHINENSGYCNNTNGVKNCYMTFDSSTSQDVYYSNIIIHSNDCLDCSHAVESKFCYGCVDVVRCTNSRFLLRSENCHDSMYLFDCRNCHYCFNCSNLRGKDYYINNEYVGKERYELFMRSYKSTSFTQQQNDYRVFMDLIQQSIYSPANLIQSEGSVGDNLTKCKNVYESYDCEEAEDCKHLVSVHNLKTAYDTQHTYKGELQLEIMGMVNSYRTAFSCWILDSSNILYSFFLNNCTDCFGCTMLKRDKFCIFNKQYTEDQYNDLVPRIIERMQADGEWGQFFPVSMSPFAYNESLAQENFPLTQKQVEKRGWLWREKQHNVGQVDKIIPAIELPDDTNDIPDDILNWALTCSATGNPYRIIPHELRFYRQHNLPIPRFHFDERHQQRMTLRNLRMLASKQCSKCVKNIQAALPKGYQGKVYCDECYLKEVY